VSDTYAACVTAPEVELGRVWRRLVGVDAGRAGDAALDELLARHRQPHRRYHTATHVMWVLRHVDDLAADSTPVDLDAVRAAALFHDAVYVAGRKDNEAKSAELARSAIETFLPKASVDVSRVVALIELTAKHGSVSPEDPDAAHFLDADMAILGSAPATFDAYDAAIADEYRPVTNALLYRFGRRRFLARLLDAPRIFHSEHFHTRLDAAARANLRRALDRE
jgi:predicted metal-dependent HD superfamily phosphohydrolase